MRKLLRLVPALIAVAVVSNTAVAADTPVGASAVNVSLPTQFQAIPGLDVSNNVAGLYLHTCTISLTVPQNQVTLGALAVGTSAPPPAGPGNVFLIAYAFNNVAQVQLPYPIYIPAGHGVFGFTNNPGGELRCTYDLVQ